MRARGSYGSHRRTWRDVLKLSLLTLMATTSPIMVLYVPTTASPPVALNVLGSSCQQPSPPWASDRSEIALVVQNGANAQKAHSAVDAYELSPK